MVTPFDDSLNRLNRAREQRDGLMNEIRAWFERKTYTISVKDDLQTGEQVCEIEQIEPLPMTWPMIACEITHHLRSALDNAIHHLFIHYTGSPVRRSEFPIFIEEREFKDAGLRRINGLPASFQRLIEDFQPFRGNDPPTTPLWVLHELSNSEKHQQLPLLEVFRSVEVDVRRGGGVQAMDIKYPNPGPLKAGTEVVRWRVTALASDGHVKANFKITRDITLDVTRPPCLNGWPLITAIDTFGVAVNAVIQNLKYLQETGKRIDEKPLDDFSI